MKKLLNKLLKRGWKPRGYENVYEFKLYKGGYTINRPQKQKLISFATETRHYINGTDYVGYKGYSLRELVSKESGLWQFVCENKLLVKGILDLPDVLWKRDSLACMRTDLRKSCYPHDYEYRLIESALKDESELENFLLQNIKVEWNENIHDTTNTMKKK